MAKDRPFRLGVTGGIASGKSTVMARLAELGAETIDADLVYHGLIAPGEPLHAALVDRWGDRIVATDGSIDRRALGSIVFSDPHELKALDALTHPAIRGAIDERYNASPADVVAIDAVKLIESGHADRCDAVWIVVADPETQVRRLMERRGLSESDARRRVEAQLMTPEKLARADVALDNTGSIEALRAEVEAAWAELPIGTIRSSDTTTRPE